MSRYRLSRSRAALWVVDIQEKLFAAMPQPARDRVTNRVVAAIVGAKALGLPIVLTEQYRKGLGPTIAPVRAALGDDKAIEKLQFSCATPEALAQLQDREQVLLVGMETHVCVFQTARDLAERGLKPYLCVDAVLSRAETDRAVGVELCREVGSVVTTVEAALFDLLGKAGTPEFKAVSQAVK